MSTSGGSAFHVTATGPVASGPGGILHTVTVGTLGTSASLTLYDGTSTSGAVIAVITPSAPATFTFDAVIANGLYAAVAGTGLDATVTILPTPEFSD